MTWINIAYYADVNVTHVGCRDGCNPYRGDTYCTSKLPILCLRRMNYPKPEYPHTCCTTCAMPCNFYDKWTGGDVKVTTKYYYGYELESFEMAS